MSDPSGERVPPEQRCPSCGNRVAIEGGKRSPDETLCTPISCAAWVTEAIYDRTLGRFVEVSDGR